MKTDRTHTEAFYSGELRSTRATSLTYALVHIITILTSLGKTIIQPESWFENKNCKGSHKQFIIQLSFPLG